MSFLDPKRTLLGAIFPERLPASLPDRALRVFSESALVATISVYLPVMLGLEHAGMISVFLAAAVLSDRLTLILEENRRSIWVFKRGGWASNKTTAWSLLLLFLGMFAAYTAVAYTIGGAGAQAAFAFTSKLAEVESASLLSHDFGSFGRILLQNLAVVVAIAFLAFLYRSYGAMLVLAWNACVWGLVFASLAANTDISSGPVSFLVACAAVLPHVIFESAAYVLVSLACLFASQALGSHTADDPRLRKVVPATAGLMAIGLAALVLAAIAEAYFTPAVMNALA